jgi:hypothetical protein
MGIRELLLLLELGFCLAVAGAVVGLWLWLSW